MGLDAPCLSRLHAGRGVVLEPERHRHEHGQSSQSQEKRWQTVYKSGQHPSVLRLANLTLERSAEDLSNLLQGAVI